MRKRLQHSTAHLLLTTRVFLAVCLSALAVCALAGCGDSAAAAPSRTPILRVRLTVSPSETPTTRVQRAVSPTDTPMPTGSQKAPVTVNDNANLRSGPGTDYERVGSAAQGDAVEIVGRNADGDWYQLATGAWIAAFLVDGAPEGLPVVGNAAQPAPTAPAAAQAAGNAPAGAVAARLASVVDGDTIDVLIDGKQETVRYIGIDTPERGQPGYRAATEANERLLGGGDLYLVADASDRDRYGRLLRYIYTTDGQMVNREMVAQGWAQPVEYPPDIRYAAELRAAALEAANADLGFWGAVGSDGAMPYALATGNVNIREGPGTGFGINTTATANTPLTVFGRTPDGEWLQVRAPDRSGGWVSAGLVALAVAASQIDVAQEIPVASVVTEVDTTRGEAVEALVAPAASAPQSTLQGIALVIIENNSTLEILQVDNRGQQAVDIGGWVLYGSKGDDRCVIPGGTILQPGEGFQVATGDSQPRARGIKCGDKPIWNNEGETIYLEAPGVGRIEIPSRRV